MVDYCPSNELRQILTNVTTPRSGPNLLACAVSYDAVGAAPERDEFFSLAYNKDDKSTYVCEWSRDHIETVAAADEIKVDDPVFNRAWQKNELLRLPSACNHETTQLILNRSATLLAVLSPNHLVVQDVNYHSSSKQRTITLVENSRSHRPLVSCSWHPTLDDVLVVLDDLSISLYYFWDAAIAAQLSSSHNASNGSSKETTTAMATTAHVKESSEGCWFWRDELHIPEFRVNNHDSPFASFCFGDQDPLDDHMDPVSWEPFTLYVLHHNGNVYAACPVIPRGLILNSDTLDAYQHAARRAAPPRHDWLQRSWARCLRMGEQEDDWKCVHYEVEGAAWYSATDNNEEHRPTELQATSLISLRGILSHSGHPVLIKTWSNGEIDLILVHSTTDGRIMNQMMMSEQGYELGTMNLARCSTFWDTPKLESPRVRAMLDEMNDHVFYVIGSHEIDRIEFDWNAFIDVLKNEIPENGSLNQRLLEGYQVYYESPEGHSGEHADQQVEGVVTYTLRPGDHRLRVLRSDGSIRQIDIGRKVQERKVIIGLTKEEENKRNDLLGAYSIVNDLDRALKLIDRPLPLLGFDKEDCRTPMNKNKGTKVQIFLQQVAELRIKPMQEYKRAVIARIHGWNRLWEHNKASLKELSFQSEKLKIKLAETRRKTTIVSNLVKQNMKDTISLTDTILHGQNYIREEEKTWFDQLSSTRAELGRLQAEFNNWLLAEDMEKKEEKICDVQLLDDCNDTFRLKITGRVPSEWMETDLSSSAKFLVRWDGKERIVQKYSESDDQSSRIRLNQKVYDLPVGTSVEIIRQTVVFSMKKTEAIRKERKRINLEKMRTRKHQRGGGSSGGGSGGGSGSGGLRRRSNKSKSHNQSQNDDLDRENARALKTQLNRIEGIIKGLKQDQMKFSLR